MAFPTTPVIDNFNRTNGDVSGTGNYLDNPLNDGSDGLEIISNQVRNWVTTFYQGAVAYSVTTFGPDSEAYISVPTAVKTTGTSEIKLWLRLVQTSASASTADGYEFFYERVGAAISGYYMRLDNTVETQLGATETLTALAAGDGLGFSMIGSQMQAWRRSGGVWSTYAGTGRTDTTYTAAGQIGFTIYEDARTALLDDFGGGTVVPSPRTLMAPPIGY